MDPTLRCPRCNLGKKDRPFELVASGWGGHIFQRRVISMAVLVLIYILSWAFCRTGSSQNGLTFCFPSQPPRAPALTDASRCAHQVPVPFCPSDERSDAALREKQLRPDVRLSALSDDQRHLVKKEVLICPFWLNCPKPTL